MPLDFDELLQEATPESLRAAMMARLAEKGLDVDTREGSYTDLLYAEAAYQIWAGAGLSPHPAGCGGAQPGVRALPGSLWGDVRPAPHPGHHSLCAADLYRRRRGDHPGWDGGLSPPAACALPPTWM